MQGTLDDHTMFSSSETEIAVREFRSNAAKLVSIEVICFNSAALETRFSRID